MDEDVTTADFAEQDTLGSEVEERNIMQRDELVQSEYKAQDVVLEIGQSTTLYDHVDHLLHEVAFAQRSHRNVQAYVKLHGERQEQGDSVTISTSITVTWLRPSKGIIHAARLLVDAITLALDDPSLERQITQLHERSRSARMLVIDALKQHDLGPIGMCCSRLACATS